MWNDFVWVCDPYVKIRRHWEHLPEPRFQGSPHLSWRYRDHTNYGQWSTSGHNYFSLLNYTDQGSRCADSFPTGFNLQLCPWPSEADLQHHGTTLVAALLDGWMGTGVTEPCSSHHPGEVAPMTLQLTTLCCLTPDCEHSCSGGENGSY